MMTQGLIDAWNRVSEETVASGWDIFDDPWGDEPADDGAIEAKDGDYEPRIVLEDLVDV
jgi:hypothetical protein